MGQHSVKKTCLLAPSQNSKNSPGVPLRTHKELAEEFGVSITKLSHEIKRSAHLVPLPITRCKSGLWYNPLEMRRWWRAHTEPLDVKT